MPVSRMTGFYFAGWALYSFFAFLSALFLAWRILAACDFAYPLWYEVLDIDQHIVTYGPRNNYRQHFELTSEDERMRLFTAMVHAIHDNGQGLEELRYHPGGSHSAGLFLTEPEIVHLHDVARLVAGLMIAGWCALAGWSLITVGLVWRKIPLPGPGRLLSGLAAAVTVILLSILLAGPVTVFYRLHEWIFPSGHQWFFFYEDSLMTTLLKAPDLFAPISLLLLFTCILFFILILLVAGKITAGGPVHEPDSTHTHRKKTARKRKKR